MDWITNEALFYGGIITAASALVIGVIYFISLHIRRLRLDIQLDEEYGKDITS